MKISIVVPFFNEEGNVQNVISELLSLHPEAEVIAVDDGSSDKTWQLLNQIDNITKIRFPYNKGQSAALLAGLHKASNEVCVLMDGDGQNDPHDIGEMVSMLSHTDGVFGYRYERKDTLIKKICSKIANQVRRLLLEDGIRDTGCSLKVFKREMVNCLPSINCVHRFIGAFFVANNYTIVEKRVNHRPRINGSSKYTNIGRLLIGIHDLLGVRWYLKRKVLTKVERDE